jgi:DNA-binding beta-propeller fold protein YncE
MARVAADGKSVIVMNHDDASLQVFDPVSLALRSTIPVAAAPTQFLILPDSTTAFVAATGTAQISVVDLRTNALLTNVPLPGKPAEMFLKPDGGELFITIPEAHELAIVNTWTHELVDARLIGSTPERAVFDEQSLLLYVSDATANDVVPVDVQYRTAGQPIPAGESPGALALDPSTPHNLLLVADESSNDLAIIRVRTGSLITMVHVGNSPRDIVVLLY